MRVVASAPGKLLLLGEYAVLEGAPALVLAVEPRAHAHVEPASADAFLVDAPDVGVSGAAAHAGAGGRLTWGPEVRPGEHARLGLAHACIEAAMSLLGSRGLDLPPAHVSIDSAAFLHATGDKLGLGSSAAVCAALLGGLLALAGRPPKLDATSLLPVALEAHRRAQGGGSGVDVAASLLGGALRYELVQGSQLPRVERLSMPAWFEPIVVWAGEPTSTPEMVARVRGLSRSRPHAYRARMADLTDVATAGCRAFAAGDAQEVLAAAASYAMGLEQLGEESGVPIVSPAHRRLGEVVRAAGGVYKPSGAGGGDIGVALAASAPGRARIRQALIEAAVEVLCVRPSHSGLEIRIKA